jgi:hypothetical protein
MDADQIRAYLSYEAEQLKEGPEPWKAAIRQRRFSGLADLLLEHGRYFERGLPPRRRGGYRRAVKSCYRNAFLNVREDPLRYVYCEGYCFGDDNRSFQHAWFIEKGNPDTALDTTLRGPGKYFYFGIPLQQDYVARRIIEGEGYSPALTGAWEVSPIITGADPPEVFMAHL